MTKAKAKTPAKAKTVVKTSKTLDGKALAAARKPRDSIAQLIKDELNGGSTDVDKILSRAAKEFPGTSPTRGYVRWVARHVLKKPLPAAGARAKPAKTKAAKVKAKAEPKPDADSAAAAVVDLAA